MLTAVPWSELVKTARRIVRGGRAGQWLAHTVEGPRRIPVRCYPASDFKMLTLVARECDLPCFLAPSGELRISTADDEILLLKFRPQAAALLAGPLKGTVFPPGRFDYHRSDGHAGSAPVLVFGLVDSVELRVPSHAIDVIASSRRGPDPFVGFSFGLN